MKLHIAKRTFLLASVFIILAPATAGALSDSQVNVLNLGIRYFNTEDTVSASSSCTSFSGGTLPTSIPAAYNSIFTAAATKFNVPPAFLAALFYAGEHGSSWPTPPAPYGNGQPWKSSGKTSPGEPDWPTQPPGPGAAGPFQFEYPTWQTLQQDGNGDGKKDVEDLTDAAFAAASYLSDLGAKGTNDVAKLQEAAYHYNAGPHADPSGVDTSAYANNVMAAYAEFSNPASANSSTQPADTSLSISSTSSCSTTSNLGPVSIIQNGSFGIGDGVMGHQPTMIGIHYTAGNEQTVQDVINDLKDPDGTKHCNQITHSCSVQLTVLPDGSIYQLTSRLDVITENIINFNDADIGIEIAGKDESTLLNNQTQFKAVSALVAQLMQEYNIKIEKDFANKAGLMGHMECDDWSQAHLSSTFSGAYSGETVNSTDSHQDPGPNYMAQLRAALGGQ